MDKKRIKIKIVMILTVFIIIFSQCSIYAAESLKFTLKVEGSGKLVGSESNLGPEALLNSPQYLYSKYYDESTQTWNFEKFNKAGLEKVLKDLEEDYLHITDGKMPSWIGSINKSVYDAVQYAIGVTSGKYSEENLMNYNIDQINEYTKSVGASNVTTKVADNWYNKVKGQKDGISYMHGAAEKISDDVKKTFTAEEIAWYLGNSGPGVDTVSGPVKKVWEETLIKTNDSKYQDELELLNPSTPVELGESEIFKQPRRNENEINSEESLEDMISDAESFVGQGDIKYNDTALQNFSKTFYNIMLTVGVFVAVIVGSILGIKIMLASAEERADAKKMLIPYVVGCFIIFGGFGIWKLVLTILENI